MKHHIKLVKGAMDEIVPETSNIDKKVITTLSVALSKSELKKMKASSGLVGKNLTNDQIIRAYLKERLNYGY